MRQLIHIFKREAVLIVAAVLAAASMAAVPPDLGYLNYVNWSVLAVLFCLMAVVAGFRRAGAFDALSCMLAQRAAGPRQLAVLLVLACFFSSAVITNDVALITFVPFTVGLLGMGRRLICVLVMETAAANLGSMLTPVGNPQNLYLYSCSGMRMGEFLRVTGPLWLLGLVLVTVCTLLLVRRDEEAAALPERMPGGPLPRAMLVRCGVLFVLCLLTVLRLVDWRITLAVTLLALLLFDRPLLAAVDYSLLATFVCFFVLVGNLARMNAVRDWAGRLVGGHELLVGAALSQIISNVPAAAMLAPFAESWSALILGVDVGGLGTLIASMASLITYRLYSSAAGAERGRFLLVFSAVNFGLLAVLGAVSFLAYGA